MTTGIEPLIVEFTDETHEDVCDLCSKVALWIGTCVDMPCEHSELPFCDEHKGAVEAHEARLGLFVCEYCDAMGRVVRWRRP